MKQKIKIQTVSTVSICIAVVLAVLFALISIGTTKEFRALKNTTNQYIVCADSANDLQSSSDYLTEQVRIFAMTGNVKYMKLYFEEVNTTKQREKALENLKKYFDNTVTFESLQFALNSSKKLEETEYYAMRLVLEAIGEEKSTWPDEVKEVALSKEDEALSKDEKRKRAQELVFNDDYLNSKAEISSNVAQCTSALIDETKNDQERATSIYSDMFAKLKIVVVVLVIVMLIDSIFIRRLVVEPLMKDNESIRQGKTFAVEGAQELQNLARTYNEVFIEKQETEKLIRHEAEHDALTGLFNRGSFEKVMKIYEGGERPFAMIIIDVDVFKSVNDTYGHAVGDLILKRVASLLTREFRSADYICRIGGDEFAIVMVEMTTALSYTIEEKIAVINHHLSNPQNEKSEEEIPAISLSVGVAFSDRQNPQEDIFKDADKALYYIKENGRSGCKVYDEEVVAYYKNKKEKEDCK